MRDYLGLLPRAQRLALWRDLQREGGFSNARDAVRGLMPDWFVRALKDRG
jgi:hypothetical protein